MNFINMLKELLLLLNNDTQDPLPTVKSEYVRMYFEHQYDRVEKLESQRLTITNIVISLTVLIFTFGFSNLQNLTFVNGVGLPVIIIILNSFAILYIRQTYKHIGQHLTRARKTLELHAKEMYQISLENPMPPLIMKQGIAGIQSSIHWILIIISVVPVAIYLYSILK
jgi:hypothetical protein